MRTALLIVFLLVPLAAVETADPAAVVAALRDALARRDLVAVRALLLAPDAAAEARLGRLADALATGAWDFTPGASRQEGGCAVVLVTGSRARAGQADRFPLYLAADAGGAWRLLADPSRPRLAEADAGRTAALAALAAWAEESTRGAAIALAGEGLGTWVLGPATVAGRALRPGQPVPAGALIAVGANRPARLLLDRMEGSSVSLAPASQAVITEERAADGTDLVVELVEGIVQLDVRARGPYAHVRVRGAASDVLVTGTVFLVQRAARGADYVAQVDGTVRVRRRLPDGRLGDDEVRLAGHQGVAVDHLGGFAPVDALTARPQLTPDRLASGGLRAQGLAGGGDWGSDRVAAAAPPAALGALPAAAPAGDELPIDAPLVLVAPPPSLPPPSAGANPVLSSSLGVLKPGLGTDSGQVPGAVGVGTLIVPSTPTVPAAAPLADPPGFPH